MPLDSRFLLQGANLLPDLPTRAEDPGIRRQTLANMGLQGQILQQHVQEGELRNKQMQGEAERARESRNILWKHQDNIEKALPELYANDPKTAEALSDHLNKRQKEMREAQEQQLKANGEKAARLGAIAGSVNTPEDYQRAKQQALKEGLATPDDLATWPSSFNTDAIQRIDQLRKGALSVATQNEEARKALVDQRAADESKAKVGGEAAKSFSSQLVTAAQAAGGATSQEEWTAFKNSQPSQIQGFIPDTYSTESAAKVAQLGLTAKDRVDEAERAKVHAETKEHNIATEADRRIYQEELIRTKDEATAARKGAEGVQSRFEQRQRRADRQEAIKSRFEYQKQIDTGEEKIQAHETAKVKLLKEQTDASKMAEAIGSQTVHGPGWEAKLNAQKARAQAAEAAIKEHVQQQQQIKARMDQAQRAKDAIRIGPEPEADSPDITPAGQNTQYSEADIRAQATQRGFDPEAAVRLARSKGLIPK